ncbi:MAG: HdeD family acid-resistance protein [Tepidisphaeraceae bacterium]
MQVEMGMTGLDVLRKHRGWFMTLGVLLIIIGMVALSATFVATLASMFVFGWLMVFAGVAHIAHAFGTRRWKGFVWHVLLGVIDSVAGIWLLTEPAVGAITLTLLVAIFLVAQGVFQIVAALTLNAMNKGWAIFSGVVSLLLGGMIWAQWPASGIWFVGMCVGIGMIFRGWTILSLALAVKPLPAAAT